jgi:hypothetical protein
MSTRNKVAFVGALALAGGVWWWTGDDDRSAPPTAAATATLAEQVLRELAAMPGGLAWSFSHGPTPPTPPYAASLAMQAAQVAPLVIDDRHLGPGVLELASATWTVRVHTPMVTEITCVRQAVEGHPIERAIVFAGPAALDEAPGTTPMTLFAVQLDDDTRFRRLCAQHRLPTRGAF